MELHDVHLLGRKPLGITTIPLHSIRHSNRVLKFVVYMVLVALPSVLGMWSMALVLLWPFEYTVPSAKTVDFPLLHSLANISVMQ